MFALLASIKDFFVKEIVVSESFSLQCWHIILAAVVFLALVIVIICCSVKGNKKKSAEPEVVADTIDRETADIIAANGSTLNSSYAKVVAPEIEQTPIQKPEEDKKVVKIESESEPVEEEKPEKVEKKSEEITVKEVEKEEAEDKEEVAPVAEEESEEPKSEPKAEEEVEEAEATEEKEEAPVVEEEPEVKEKTAPAEKAKTAKPKKEEEKPVEKVETAEEKEPAKEAEHVAAPQVEGKIEICNSNLDGFNYLLRANNGQLLYESRTYKTKDGCIEAVSRFIDAVAAGMFTVRADKFKNYKFILKSPTSNTLLYLGESFSSESACLSNIESVKRFAQVSPIIDVTEEDFVAKFEYFEIPENVVAAVDKKEGAIGKWEITQVDTEVKNSPYIYLLYANNGQLLFESRDYKTYASCKSGLETFVKTVKNGNFVVDPDKSGRFKFVLRSKAANSTMEYVGQSYDTKQACESSIASVYRFALRSPYDEI